MLLLCVLRPSRELDERRGAKRDCRAAQKSRVITEDAFSLLPANSIVDTKTFNALFDNSTMRNPLTGEASTQGESH